MALMGQRLEASEAQILRAVMDYLAARHVFAIRMQTGAVKIDTRFVRFGIPGMADVLAFVNDNEPLGSILPVWIECKTATGKQSELQQSFQSLVESHGHRYGVCRSIEDVDALLR